MNNTPSSNKKNIAIYGKTNAGKSSLINAIIGQDISIVSDMKGTTTDPVRKSMELIPFGPVLFIDTAGLNDQGKLGELRVKKTLKILQRTDFAVYILDIKDKDLREYHKAIESFKKFNIPYMTVINKVDRASDVELADAKRLHKKAVFISALNKQNILLLKDELINNLHQEEEDPRILGDIVPYNGKVVMVVPIDSEAPKGRIILPQVQVIRDCLDHGIKSYVVRDTELNEGLKDLKDIDLVVTDSQAFGKVNKMVPENIYLTSFSVLFARYKGNLEEYLSGIEKINTLNENSKILISESCTHNHSHEDIGRVKIPKLLNNHLGENLNYEFKMGHDFPEDLEKYDFVIHCGACMVNRKTMINRINMCKENNLPITNYGVLLAHLTGILSRAVKVF